PARMTRVGVIPSRRALAASGALLAATTLALLAQVPQTWVCGAVAACAGLVGLWAAADLWLTLRAWREAPLRVEHRWPEALALGVKRVVVASVANGGSRSWTISLFDDVDPSVAFDGLPQTFRVAPGHRVELSYFIVPRRRGSIRFGATQLRVRSLGGVFELRR